jgi:hypothetical protein
MAMMSYDTVVDRKYWTAFARRVQLIVWFLESLVQLGGFRSLIDAAAQLQTLTIDGRINDLLRSSPEGDGVQRLRGSAFAASVVDGDFGGMAVRRGEHDIVGLSVVSTRQSASRRDELQMQIELDSETALADETKSKSNSVVLEDSVTVLPSLDEMLGERVGDHFLIESEVTSRDPLATEETARENVSQASAAIDTATVHVADVGNELEKLHSIKDARKHEYEAATPVTNCSEHSSTFTERWTAQASHFPKSMRVEESDVIGPQTSAGVLEIADRLTGPELDIINENDEQRDKKQAEKLDAVLILAVDQREEEGLENQTSVRDRITGEHAVVRTSVDDKRSKSEITKFTSLSVEQQLVKCSIDDNREDEGHIKYSRDRAVRMHSKLVEKCAEVVSLSRKLELANRQLNEQVFRCQFAILDTERKFQGEIQGLEMKFAEIEQFVRAIPTFEYSAFYSDTTDVKSITGDEDDTGVDLSINDSIGGFRSELSTCGHDATRDKRQHSGNGRDREYGNGNSQAERRR